MRVVIVSTSDIDGGAAKAAYRLHRSLLLQHVDSLMFVQKKKSDEYRVVGPSSKYSKLFYYAQLFFEKLQCMFYKRRSKTFFSSATLSISGIPERINELKPDVVHLHWIARGMMGVAELNKIEAPIVWSLHDMWAFSGGCHYDEECNGYKKTCGNCKVLGSNKSNDLSRRNFIKKNKSYSKLKNMTINGTSNWMTSSARSSTLFSGRDIVTIPNPIDTSVFRPLDKTIARALFGIPENKKIILFGSINPLGDPRKGLDVLVKSLALLQLDDVDFVIAGSSHPEEPMQLKYPSHYVPPLHDEVSLPLLYNIADVVIVPSLQENLANSIVESLACGIPVVAFNVGGNSDLVDHKINGYLAEPFECEDMAFGIEWVLGNSNYESLSSSARKKVISNYENSVVSSQYIDLYKSIISTSSGKYIDSR